MGSQRLAVMKAWLLMLMLLSLQASVICRKLRCPPPLKLDNQGRCIHPSSGRVRCRPPLKLDGENRCVNPLAIGKRGIPDNIQHEMDSQGDTTQVAISGKVVQQKVSTDFLLA